MVIFLAEKRKRDMEDCVAFPLGSDIIETREAISSILVGDQRIMEMIELKINGEARQVQVEKNWTLLYVLREVLDLTGAECGCNTGRRRVQGHHRR